MSQVGDTQDLAEDLGLLSLNSEPSDVTFVVEDTKIKAHRSVLAAKSEFFEKLLIDNKFKEGELSEIPIEAPAEAFKLLMKFFYTAELKLEDFKENFEAYTDLLELSRRYDVKDLEKLLMDYFGKNINSENVLEILDIAIFYESSMLKYGCLRLLSLDTYSHEKASELPISKFKVILGEGTVTMAIDKFYALQKWLSKNPECSETDKEDLTKIIDLKRLSNHQIRYILKPSNLFKDGYLLSFVANREVNVPEEPFSYSFIVISGKQVHFLDTNNDWGFPQQKSKVYATKTGTIILKLNTPAYRFSFWAKISKHYGTRRTINIQIATETRNNQPFWTNPKGEKAWKNNFTITSDCDTPMRFIKVKNVEFINDWIFG